MNEYRNLTKEQLKVMLDRRSIKYFRGADKETLIGLLEDYDKKSEKENDEVDIKRIKEQAAKDAEAKYEAKLAVIKKEIEEKYKKENNSAPQMYTDYDMSVYREELEKESLALERVSVSFNDPSKKDWPGEILRVGNDFLDPTGYYIPNDLTVITHLPKLIVDYLEDENTVCTIFRKERGKEGKMIEKSHFMPKYTVQHHRPLTEKELEALAYEQQKSGSLGE